MELKEQLQSKINYIIVAIVSFVGMGIIPFLSVAFDENLTDEEIIRTIFPQSTIGWIMWAIMRAIIILVNILIFIPFVNQGKINASKNEKYLKGLNLWETVELKRGKTKKQHKKNYMTPTEHYAKVYSKKISMIALTTFATLFEVGYLIICWDLTTFLSIVLTIVLCLVFGVISMFKETEYWICEFPIRAQIEYDLMLEEENNNV